MAIVQLSVFVENKPGMLLEALNVIAGSGIDLRALSLADSTDYGILRVIVDKPELALKVLRENDYLVEQSKVIPVAISDHPGGLASVLRVLAKENIDVEYTYAFIAHGKNRAYVVLRVDDNGKAVEILKNEGIDIITSEDKYGL